MTVLTTPAQPGPGNGLPPVPWSKLAWVSWRHYRIALAGAATFLGVLALYLLIFGLKIRGAYASASACSPGTGGQACQGAFQLFDNEYHNAAEVTAAVLNAVTESA